MLVDFDLQNVVTEKKQLKNIHIKRGGKGKRRGVGTLRYDNELNHYYTKFDTVLIIGLADSIDVAAITEKCETFGAVKSVRRPEVRVHSLSLVLPREAFSIFIQRELKKKQKIKCSPTSFFNNK